MRKNAFELLLVTFAASLAIGKTLWLPLFLMSILGLYELSLRVKRGQVLQHGEGTLLVVASSVLFPSLMSVLNTSDLERTLKYVATLPLFFGVGYFAYCRASKGLNTRLTIIGIGIIYLIWSIAVIWQFLTPESPFGASDGGRYHGFFANHLGGDLKMPVVAVGFGFFLTGLLWKIGARFIAAGCLISVVLLVILSGTRMVWLSMFWVTVLCSLLYVMLYPRKALYWFLPVSLAVLISGYGVWLGIKDSPLVKRIDQSLVVFETLNYSTINIALSNRLPMWEDTLNMGFENPVVGTGANAWRYAYPDYAPSDSAGRLIVSDESGRQLGGYLFPHQHVLEVFAAAGFPGLFGLITIYAALFRAVYLSTRKRNPLAISISIALLSYFFPINTHHAFYSSWITAWFWLWFGMLQGFLHASSCRHETHAIEK